MSGPPYLGCKHQQELWCWPCVRELGAAQDAQIAALEAEVARLRAAVFAPGHWKCLGCGFRLVQNIISLANGNIYANKEKAEPRPNDNEPMVRVEWKEIAQSIDDVIKHATERIEEVQSTLPPFVALAMTVQALLEIYQPLADDQDPKFAYWRKNLQARLAHPAVQRAVKETP